MAGSLAARSRPSTPRPTTSASSPSPRAPPASRRARCISTATCSRSATPTARNVLRPEPDDLFIGSPPLAFTFGLGGLRAVPAARRRRRRCCSRRPAPDELLPAIARHRATICFTAPTAYRAMLAQARRARRLVACANASRPARRCRRRPSRPGRRRPASSSSTASARPRCCTSSSPRARTRSGPAPPASRCRATRRRSSTRTGSDAAAAARSAGSRCAARPAAATSPTSASATTCRTAGTSPATPTCMDEDGYFWYQARTDDMIISAGYNIAGPEVEAALLTHPAVAECGVVGAPDAERGMIVKAFVVLQPGRARRARRLAKALQDHVKAGDRALQISARDRVRRRAAAHRRPASCSASRCARWRRPRRKRRAA